MAIAHLRVFPTPPTPAPGPWRAADVERFPDDGYQYEIWHGELVRMAPAGGRHGEIEANLVAALRVQLHALGRAYTGDTGFLLGQDPDELVSPDVAFVRHDRLPSVEKRRRYLRVVPDLVVEIRSPNDEEADVQAKLQLYVSRGVPLIWSVDPRSQTVDELRQIGEPTGRTLEGRRLTAHSDDVLENAEVLPGFRLSVHDVFA